MAVPPEIQGVPMLFDRAGLSLGATLLIFGAICFILRERGLRVIVPACCFVASLVTTQLFMKRLSSPPLRYRYPGFITALHFWCVCCACCLYWYVHGDMSKLTPQSLGSTKRFLMTALPIAFSNPLTVVFNNKALVHLGAGLCAVFGTLSPIAIALLAAMWGRGQSWTSWLGVLVASLGGLLIVQYEIKDVRKINAVNNVGLGIMFALLSVGLRAIKIVLMDNLLAPASYKDPSEEPISPMHLYAVQAPGCFLVALAFAFATESIEDALADLSVPVVSSITMTCISAVALNFLGVFSLRDLGASMQQIIGKLNTICTISLSVGMLGEDLPPIVVIGSVVVLVGVGIFERGKTEGATKVSAKIDVELTDQDPKRIGRSQDHNRLRTSQVSG
eukprot:TRINITY_DN39369_c0_g1_i1.p1 TRINITY_DN39369_c0_g1~~TRINITY_DN39369_c0_g1_i1.p1  ORF type:complete len:390 (+),score=48.42 TRINITY_DN39369_c0_g1_i1:38-1207(+)